MNELALFAGGGGGLLASQWLKGWRTVCYVEREPYAVAVIRARIADGLFHDAPIWDDVGTFDGRPWRGCVDIVTAGFPCQPFSVAGLGRAGDDERNGWPDTIRIIDECRPRYALLENTPGLLAHGYFGTILADLAACGYHARWRVLSAAEMGAPHKRDRLWIVAHTGGDGLEGAQRQGTHRAAWQQAPIECDTLPDPNGLRRHGRPRQFWTGRRRQSQNSDWWAVEPGVVRVVHGLAHRVHRIKALGNGQVPSVAARAWDLLTEDADPTAPA